MGEKIKISAFTRMMQAHHVKLIKFKGEITLKFRTLFLPST